jgi:hypothetical protein
LKSQGSINVVPTPTRKKPTRDEIKKIEIALLSYFKMENAKHPRAFFEGAHTGLTPKHAKSLASDCLEFRDFDKLSSEFDFLDQEHLDKIHQIILS